MSTLREKVAPRLSTSDPGAVAVPEKRRRRKRPYKAFLATKVKWALGDAMERSIAAQAYMRKVHEWMAETRSFDWVDAKGLLHLGRLEHELLGLAIEVAEMERILANAIAESKTAKDAEMENKL